jgi:hypothetical protein
MMRLPKERMLRSLLVAGFANGRQTGLALADEVITQLLGCARKSSGSARTMSWPRERSSSGTTRRCDCTDSARVPPKFASGRSFCPLRSGRALFSLDFFILPAVACRTAPTGLPSAIWMYS